MRQGNLVKEFVSQSRRARIGDGRALIGTFLAAFAGLAAGPAHAATIPGGIPSNCSADATRQIQTWIDSVPDNSVLSFPHTACYRIDGTLELTNRNGLDFEGNNATFKAITTGDGSRSQWRATGGANLTFRNMTVQGASPVGGTLVWDLQWQHAFDLRGVNGVEIDSVAASDLYGDCIYVGRPWNGTEWSSNIYVHDSACARNGRMGIAVTAAHDVLVERTSFARIARTALDVEPNGSGFGARSIAFRNNRATGPLPGGFLTLIGDGPIDSVTISNNRLSGVGMYMAVLAPEGQRRSNISVTGNSSDSGYYAPGSAALDFECVDGLTVTGNSIPLSSPNTALASVSESCNVNVHGNGFPGGVTEARVSPYPCRSISPDGLPAVDSATLTRLAATSITLQVTKSAPAKASARRHREKRLHGRVLDSRSGRVSIRLQRFDRRGQRWVTVRTRQIDVRKHRFSTRVRDLHGGRWRARATFQGTRKHAMSRSAYRYFRLG